MKSYYTRFQIEPANIFTHKTQNSHSRVIVVEGDPGTGKSYLSHVIASKWANNSSIFGEEKIMKLLFHLDLRIESPNLKCMLFDQIFNVDIKLTEREIWDVIEKNQKTCLFIIDGYNNNANEEILQLVSGTLLPHSNIIIFSNSSSTNQLRGLYQEKLVLTGFLSGESLNFANKYIKLVNQPYERFSNLTRKLKKSNSRIKARFSESSDFENKNLSELAGHNRDIQNINGEDTEITIIGNQQFEATIVVELPKNDNDFSTANNQLNVKETNIVPVQENMLERESSDQDKLTDVRFYSQFPLYCSFFCLITDLQLSIDLTSWSGMLEQYFTAMKMKLVERERENRFSVNRIFNTLVEQSFDALKQNASTTFIKADSKITKFGILRRLWSTGSNTPLKYVFNNDIMHNFLSAKCLDLYGLEEANNYFQKLIITDSIHTFITSYCGIKRKDFENAVLRTLFKKLIDLNLQILIVNPGTVGNSKSRSRSVNIMKFQLSLDCVAAMNGRNDLTLKVGQTLPEKLLVEHTCTIPILTLQGLSYIIGLSCSNIKELDIRLNYLSRQTPEAYQILANSIQKNTSIKTLRIYWEQLELMSVFFSKICEKNEAICQIECYSASGHKYDNFTSFIALNIRNACRNMKHVQSFAFTDCDITALVHSVIRNVPDNLISLDLSGCNLTIIACKDLAEKISQTKYLRIVKLEKAQMQSTAFNSFIQPLNHNRTVVELHLNGIKMDNLSFFGLAEALKLNIKLEKLFLLDITINENNCSELAQVMRVTNTLKELHVTENRVYFLGQKELNKSSKNTKVFGLSKQVTNDAGVNKVSSTF